MLSFIYSRYLEKHPKHIDGTHLECFLPDDETWTTYIARMARSGQWGDHIVLKGLSDFLGLKIVIFNAITVESFNHHEIQPETCDPERNESLYLGHLGEFHYVSLRPRDWEQTWANSKHLNCRR